MALSQQEKDRRKKINGPILKYGCLPIIVLTIIFFTILMCKGSSITIDQTGKKFNPKTTVKEFCVWSIDSLSSIYGKPMVTEFEGQKDYQWTLNKKDGLKVTVFTNKKNEPEVVRFNNIDLGTFFWESLGWDKNNLQVNSAAKTEEISNLNGVKKATYKPNTKTLNIELKPYRFYNSFGIK